MDQLTQMIHVAGVERGGLCVEDLPGDRGVEVELDCVLGEQLGRGQLQQPNPDDDVQQIQPGRKDKGPSRGDSLGREDGQRTGRDERGGAERGLPAPCRTAGGR